MGQRANAIAERLERGAKALDDFVSTLNDEQWKVPVPGDGRTIGVIVHHVASVYPLEIQLAQTLGAGKPIEGVTYDDVHKMNAGHAKDHVGVTKAEALELLRTNSRAAATAVRAFTDAQLDSAAPASINWDAPVTAQFMIEDHAMRHSYHHLGRIKGALRR